MSGISNAAGAIQLKLNWHRRLKKCVGFQTVFQGTLNETISNADKLPGMTIYLYLQFAAAMENWIRLRAYNKWLMWHTDQCLIAHVHESLHVSHNPLKQTQIPDTERLCKKVDVKKMPPPQGRKPGTSWNRWTDKTIDKDNRPRMMHSILLSLCIRQGTTLPAPVSLTTQIRYSNFMLRIEESTLPWIINRFKIKGTPGS